MFSISRFAQITKPVTQGVFQRYVDKHQADRYTKRLSCQNLLLAMVFAQLDGCRSLRTLQSRFNSHPQHHYHHGSQPVHRCTLSDALAKRNCQPCAERAMALRHQCSRKLRQQGQQLLYLLDSTPIELKGHGFEDWASRNGRITGLKLHVLMDAATHCPAHQSITAANVNDIDEGRRIDITAGATYVFDKGYCDYAWWHRIHAAGAFFVTRAKRTAALERLSSQALPEQAGHILADERVGFKHRQNRGQGRINPYHGQALRRITVEREDGRPLVLLSNLMQASAEHIAALYKWRWQIELWFKWIKQRLNIRRFMGSSENAVKLQLLCALIAYLLLKLYQKALGNTDSLHLFMARLTCGLFEREQTQYAYYRRRQQAQALLRQRQAQLW